MARTELGAALTQQHRVRQQSIRAVALQGLLALWAGVDPLNLAGTIGLFATVSAGLVRARNQESAALAARYVEAFRRAEGAAGALAVSIAPPPTAVQVAGLIRGAGLSGIIKARQRGMSPQVAARNGFTRVAGTATSLVLDGGRDVVTEAALSDRAATGKWQRVASSGACAWCAMQASRGPVFSERKFRKHDGCDCSSEVVFEGSDLPETSRVFREQWKKAQDEIGPDVTGTSNDALNAFRRLREGRPTDGRLVPVAE